MLLLLTLPLQFYIVSGGHLGDSNLASTEILKKNGGTSWSTVASLPTARGAISGVSLPDGRFLISGEGGIYMWCGIIIGNLSFTIPGGDDVTNRKLTEVLIYDPEADQWNSVGHLATARSIHAMSIVPREIADFCV